jgi:hypothetical protein
VPNNSMGPPKSVPNRKPKSKKAAAGRFANAPNLDENLRAAGLSPPAGVSPLQLASLLMSQEGGSNDATLASLQELLLSQLSPPPAMPQPHTAEPADDSSISPSQQILMLLEENGITGPPVPHQLKPETSPFDFSGAMQPPPPPASGAKGRKGANAGARGARKAKGAMPMIDPSRRESEEGDKRLSAGSILELFEQVESHPMGAAVYEPPMATGTPAVDGMHRIDASLCEGGKQGEGTSPSFNQLSPINPLHLNDLLTAF